jgi:hypothetical protein
VFSLLIETNEGDEKIRMLSGEGFGYLCDDLSIRFQKLYLDETIYHINVL